MAGLVYRRVGDGGLGDDRSQLQFQQQHHPRCVLGDRLRIRLRFPLHSEPATGCNPIGLGTDGRTELRGKSGSVASCAMGGYVAESWDFLAAGRSGYIRTALAHYLLIRSLAYLRAQLVSVVTALESVYAIVFAVLLLGEMPGLRTLAGGAVILGAVVVATLGRREH